VSLWAVYAAFARDTDGAGLVKIGVSSRPVLRVAEINSGSPFPIIAYLWGWVGRRDQAFKAEALVKREFAARCLRGEWFHFDFDPSSGDKAEFHRSVKQTVKAVSGRDLEWTRGDMEQVRIYKNLTRRRRNRRPVKPNQWG
jgi:hypothetical protein